MKFLNILPYLMIASADILGAYIILTTSNIVVLYPMIMYCTICSIAAVVVPVYYHHKGVVPA